MSARKINQLFELMWEDYLKLNQDARRIYDLFFSLNNGDVVNDHIALRTFNLKKVNLSTIAAPFIRFGFQEKGSYDFKQKKIRAKHFEHANPSLPKIFISELLTEKFSTEVQQIIEKLVAQINPPLVQQDNFCFSGCHWKISEKNYTTLLNESDYAAWVAALGYRPNHFTVSVNHLKSHRSIDEVVKFIDKNGFKLNDSGGLIKGSEKIGLKQSSTIANTVLVDFEDCKKRVPGCFYEFAERFVVKGNLYHGFVTASADRIFESTDVKIK